MPPRPASASATRHPSCRVAGGTNSPDAAASRRTRRCSTQTNTNNTRQAITSAAAQNSKTSSAICMASRSAAKRPGSSFLIYLERDDDRTQYRVVRVAVVLAHLHQYQQRADWRVQAASPACDRRVQRQEVHVV